MRRGRYVTIFVPESLELSEGLWRRYVISSVFLDLEEKNGTLSGKAYVFPDRCAAYHASARCVMPRITSGCAVLPYADLSDDTGLTQLPDSCVKVLDVKHFHSPFTSYFRLKLG